jgi:hypothetical protein
VGFGDHSIGRSRAAIVLRLLRRSTFFFSLLLLLSSGASSGALSSPFGVMLPIAASTNGASGGGDATNGVLIGGDATNGDAKDICRAGAADLRRLRLSAFFSLLLFPPEANSSGVVRVTAVGVVSVISLPCKASWASTEGRGSSTAKWRPSGDPPSGEQGAIGGARRELLRRPAADRLLRCDALLDASFVETSPATSDEDTSASGLVSAS